MGGLKARAADLCRRPLKSASLPARPRAGSSFNRTPGLAAGLAEWGFAVLDGKTASPGIPSSPRHPGRVLGPPRYGWAPLGPAYASPGPAPVQGSRGCGGMQLALSEAPGPRPWGLSSSQAQQ